MILLSNCIAPYYNMMTLQYNGGDMGRYTYLSRNEDKVSSELFMSIKGILA